MKVQYILRIVLPFAAALAVSKAGWIYALMFQRDHKISPFQKIATKYASLFVLGMGYLILWQFEIDAALHIREAWRGLLAVWAIVVIWIMVRVLARANAKSVTYDSSQTSSPIGQK